MMRFSYKFFGKNSIVSKAGSTFIFCSFESVFAFTIRINYPHTFTATTGACLEHHWITNIICYLNSLISIRYSFCETRDNIYPSLFCYLFRFNFVTHTDNRPFSGTNKNNFFFIKSLCKLFILR